ncbi:MAG: phoP 4, partial [Acidobacteria bacterium]|nr:phoP 4 [Acidobacteriota bacterium]
PPDDSIWARPPAAQHPVMPFVEPPAAAVPGVPAPRAELNDYFDRLDAAFSTLPPGAPPPSPTPIPPIPDPPAASIETEIDWFTNAPATGSAQPWDLPASPAFDAAIDLPLSYVAPEPQIATPEEPATAAPDAAPDDRLSAIEESIPLEPEVAGPEPTAEISSTPDAVHEPVAPLASSDIVMHHAAASAPAPVPTPEPTPVPAFELPMPNRPPLPPLADAFAALLAAEQGEALTAASALWPTMPPPAPPAVPPAAVTDDIIEDVVRRVLDRLSDTVVRESIAEIASQVAERLVREEIERIKASIK